MSLFSIFKDKLSKTSNILSFNILEILKNKKIDDLTLEELENVLISSDISLDVVNQLIDSIKKIKISNDDGIKNVLEILAQNIESILLPREHVLINEKDDEKKILIFVGVNGSGKTTTIGKIANKILSNKKILIAACDTFRAAAVEQLEIWGRRANVPVLTGEQGSDPAALTYDSMVDAEKTGTDILMIDTAGRLQNKTDLMEQLAKIVRVLRKVDPTAPQNTLLVLDASVGQNAVSQVEIFQKTADVSGLIMTKLDGTAKGGILVALADRFKLPIHAIGIGEAIDDLQPFDPNEFTSALTGVDKF